jgi:hypothetical protein
MRRAALECADDQPRRPGLGTFADVAAYMRGVGEAARAASRVLARADTAAKDRALARWRRRSGATRRS